MKCSSRRNCNIRTMSYARSIRCLNEVQFPKELQLMKPFLTIRFLWTGLNEVQFPKELQPVRSSVLGCVGVASMKCSSRRNCNFVFPRLLPRRISLNEVQFPKELQRAPPYVAPYLARASMKCSSRRNCNRATPCRHACCRSSLNEVQFPKELQLVEGDGAFLHRGASMKCSSRRNCNPRSTRLRPVRQSPQ